MKKFFKIFGIVLLFIGVVAFIICKSVIPEQTDIFVENVKVFMDRPIVIAGFTVTVGSILIFFITRYVLNERKFSRNKLNELEEKINDSKKFYEENKNELIKKVDVFYKEMIKGFETLNSDYDKLKDAVKLIPNKKVQEALKDEDNSTEASN